MDTRAARFGLVAIIVAASSLTGCTKVLMQGVYEVRGARAKLHLVNEIDDHALMRFQSVRFEPMQTTIGDRLCPPLLHGEFNHSARQWRQELAEHFPGGDPGLTIHSEVQYFQEKGLLSSALMLTRVKFREQDSVVADGVVLAKSKAYSAGGESALAGATLKAIGKFLLRQKGVEEEEEE